MANFSPRPPLAERLAEMLARHSSIVLVTVLFLTAALVLPFVLLAPTSFASQNPGGEIFETQELVADRFASRAYRMVYIVEARQGDLLRREPLLELRRNTEALRRDPEVGSKLLATPDRGSGREVAGPVTIADAVEADLRARGEPGLEGASDQAVAAAVERVLAARGPERFGLSVKTSREGGRWRSPALLVYVLADNEALGGGGQVVGLGTNDTTREELAREVLGLLRGDERHLRVWGLAIDANLTAAEQGASTGPYIGLTIFAVLLLVGLAFRSYWSVAVTGLALGALMVWLKGLCNLFGLKNDLILDTIVPIAMISFGVDFVFHAVGRYREEKISGRPPRPAFLLGFGGVLGALVLAMASDAAAFLSNTTTGIESLVQFGVGAAVATVAAFVVLGLAAPLALMRIEERIAPAPSSRRAKVFGALGGLAAALTAMAAVVVSIFIKPWLGAVMLAGYLLVFLIAPLIWLRARRGGAIAVPPSPGPGDGPAAEPPPPEPCGHRPPSLGRGSRLVGAVVVAVARARFLVLPLIGLLTLYCVYLASKVRADFDVRDFFDASSGFVVGLDKFEEHVGDQSGEPAYIYIEAGLDRPEVLGELRGFAERLARNTDDRVRLDRGVLGVVSDVMGSPAARAAVTGSSGLQIEDRDDDGLPDQREQIAAIYGFARANGVPGEGGQLLRTPDAARTALWVPERDREGLMATVLTLRIPDSRSQEATDQVRAELEPLVAELSSRLRRHDGEARAVLTGPPIARQATLEAILWAFRLSIPVAMVLCLIISAVFMRSLSYAAVSVVPILIVVAWLYAYMYLMGYGVNVVTATIGAISIGIGIDFAVHLTMRFREEAALRGDRFEALWVAGAGTGGALAASALSSVVGFAILAQAPMPMFATYGVLTSVMIILALGASLLVLPSLLLLVTRKSPLEEMKRKECG